MDIAIRLDLAMRAARITVQTELAKKSGVPISKINRILSNHTKTMDAEDAYKLAKACNVPVAWLISGEDDTGEMIDHAILYKSESDLINLYRNCDAAGRASILAAAKAALQTQASGEPEEK